MNLNLHIGISKSELLIGIGNFDFTKYNKLFEYTNWNSEIGIFKSEFASWNLFSGFSNFEFMKWNRDSVEFVNWRK